MKMTRMEWRYLQKVALDHPYFDTHELPLTEKEAKAIVKANIGMTGREFVDSVYETLGMTRPEEKKERFAWIRSVGSLFTVPPIRRIAIAVLVVILMTVFFAATPTGRAIAESVIRYFSTILDDGRVAAVRSDVDTTTEHDRETEANAAARESAENQSIRIPVASFDEFTAKTGRTPVSLPLPCTELYYEHDAFLGYVSLHAAYDLPDETIVTVQIWSTEDILFSTDAGYQTYDAADNVYDSLEEDGSIHICKVYEESCLTVIARGSLSTDELMDMLGGWVCLESVPYPLLPQTALPFDYF